MSEGMNPKWYKEFFEEMGVEYEDYPFTKNTENEVAWMIKEYLTNPEMKSLFKQVAGNNQPILIKADRRASLGRVVEVWDMCRDLGITQINIATNQE